MGSFHSVLFEQKIAPITEGKGDVVAFARIFNVFLSYITQIFQHFNAETPLASTIETVKNQPFHYKKEHPPDNNL